MIIEYVSVYRLPPIPVKIVLEISSHWTLRSYIDFC